MDSKISQLPTATKVYDGDLLVAVTGYDKEGSYPDNVKISLDRIRYDIVRLDEMIYLLSGFSGYYNSGNNTMTITSHQYPGNLINLDYKETYPYIQIISTTGINSVAGNQIEIQFANSTPAANKYGNVGSPYYSGIISVTGLNAQPSNRIHIDNSNTWPYSGLIATTGLNMVAHTGISYAIDDTWPHEYHISTIDRSKLGSNVTVLNTGSGFTRLLSSIQPITTISYGDLYGSKNYTSFKLLVTAMFKISNIVFANAPYVAGAGETNDRKNEELSSLHDYSYTYDYYSCNNDIPVVNQATKVFTSGDFLNFDPGYVEYINNTFDLTIGISGGGSAGFVNDIHTYPITLQNSNDSPGSATTIFYEIYNRTGIHFSTIDPIIIQEPITITLNSAEATQNNSLCLCAQLSNVKYRRSYSYTVGTSDYCTEVVPVNFEHIVEGYANTNASISCKILKAEYILD